MKPARLVDATMLLLSLLLVGAAVALLVLTRTAGSTALYLAQGVLVVSVALLWIFRMRLLKPLHTLATGINLLREQDYGSRLRRVGQPEVDRIVDMFNDMMERLKQERLHVREQNHFLDLVIGASPMGVVLYDSAGSLKPLNAAASHFLSADPVLAERIRTLRHGESLTLRLTDAMIYRCTRLSYMHNGYAHHFATIERLTDEIMAAERAAYERVIRMMAHEVNNTVAAVGSAVDTAAFTSDDPDIAEALRACRRRCLSLSEFVTSFANVVKIPDARMRGIDLNLFVLDCRHMLESLCRSFGIDIAFHTEEEPIQARLDTALMEQVLINIVKNAAESIGSEGRVDVRVLQNPVRVIVEDNGPGIDAAAQQKIFTPFFTSKTSGRGLGLLLASDILKKHGCSYSLRTDADGITRFTISFP